MMKEEWAHHIDQKEVYTPSLRPRAMPPREQQERGQRRRIDGIRITDGVGNQRAVRRRCAEALQRPRAILGLVSNLSATIYMKNG